jgi:hypothetical protein
MRAGAWRRAAAVDALGGGVFARRLVGLVEVDLRAEVVRLDEVDDAPEVEQAVFQRGAGEGEAVLGLELLDALGDLGARVLDELRLVQDERLELELLEFLEVAAQQGVVGDDDVEVGDLLAQVVAEIAAFQHEHAHGRVNFSASRRQLWRTEAGQMTRTGLDFLPCVCLSQSSQVRVCRVLPRPMSSARMPPSLTL